MKSIAAPKSLNSYVLTIASPSCDQPGKSDRASSICSSVKAVMLRAYVEPCESTTRHRSIDPLMLATPPSKARGNDRAPLCGPFPERLLQREGGPAGQSHAGQIDHQLQGAPPYLLARPEGQAQGDVARGRDCRD